MTYSAFLEPTRWTLRDNESLFNYWISLTPAAMLFGVRWRFADALSRDAAPVAPRVVAQAAPKTVRAPDKAVTELSAPVETAAEPAVPTPTIVAKAQPALLYSAPPQVVDDLTQIKGIGPKLEKALNQMGIYNFAQISEFSAANLEWIAANLRVFKNRPTRDNWIQQANDLKQ